MLYYEIKGDVFDFHDKGYTLVHCISADFALGAGIAKEFDRRYHLRDDLLLNYGDEWWKTFDSKCLVHVGKNVVDLVTKERYWHKPTLSDMESALIQLHKYCVRGRRKKLAMPRIGCGLDRLNWDDVSGLIQKIFADDDIEIVVCYL